MANNEKSINNEDNLEFDDDLEVVDEPSTKSTGKKESSPNNIGEDEVEKIANERAEKIILQYAIKDPTSQLAKDVKRHLGVDKLPGEEKEISNIENNSIEDTRTSDDIDFDDYVRVSKLEDKISSLERKLEEKEKKEVWEKVNNEVKKTFEQDEFLSTIPEAQRESVHNTLIADFFIKGGDKQGNGKLKEHLSEWKNNLIELKKHWNSEYIRRKKEAQLMPVSPQKAIDNIVSDYDEKERKATGADLLSGKLKKEAEKYFDMIFKKEK